MPDENDTAWPPSRPPRTVSNASQVSVASVRLYRRSVPSTKFDAGTSGVFRGAPGTRSGRPPTMAQVSGFIGGYLEESELLVGRIVRHEHQLGVLDDQLRLRIGLRRDPHGLGGLLWRGPGQQLGDPLEVG